MNIVNARRRLSLAAVIAAAALAPATAQAGAGPTPADCETGVERLEERFREVEERRGYEAATKWWETHWRVYYKRCVSG
jgi:hypothetical protein